MEFTIIQCDRDVARWPLQAYSLGRFLDPSACDRLSVYYIGAQFQSFARTCQRHAKHLGELASKLHLHDVARHFHIPAHIDGWHAQQAIKLLAATQCQTEHYMVLDAKNFLLRPTGHEDLFKHGKPVSFLMDNNNHLGPRYAKSHTLLGVEPWFPTARSMPAWTPYILKRDVVLDMLSWIDQHHGSPNLAEFITTQEVTEFFLYAAHLSRHADPATVYHFTDPFVTGVWKKAVSSPARLQTRLNTLLDEKFLFCGIHTNVFRLMDKTMAGSLHTTLGDALKLDPQTLADLLPDSPLSS